MLKLTIVSVICGAMLGNYFKIVVLPLALALGVTLITAKAIVDPGSTYSIIGACILFAVCIQSGYLAGAFFQPFASRHTSAQPGYNRTGRNRMR
jgi:hypothetical protein